MGTRVLSGLGTVLLLAASAMAQVMTVTAGVLRVGQKVEITYADPNRAGDVITVTIDDGSRPTPHLVEVDIHLDQTGKGSVNWTVPDWWSASFNAPGVQEITRAIDLPTPLLARR